MSVTAFIPVKESSKRAPLKNFRNFGDSSKSLLEIKLQQLCKLDTLDEIVVSSDSSKAKATVADMGDPRIRFEPRAERLAADDTNIRDLVAHACEVSTMSDILWTHVTSPFFGSKNYEEAISQYRQAKIEGFDSLISVEVLNKYAIFNGFHLNFGSEDVFWPRTQDLEPVFVVNSAIFIAGRDLMKASLNRIGTRVHYLETDAITGLDIDTEKDFLFAESLARLHEGLMA